MIAVQPLTQAEYEAFVAMAAEDYAQRLVADAGLPLDQARALAARDTAAILPQGRLTPQHFFSGARNTDTSELVGYLWWSVDATHALAHLYQVFVLESHRGQGLGRTMLEHLHAALRGQGIRRITLNVFAQNRGAIALYEKQGYHVMRLNMTKLL